MKFNKRGMLRWFFAKDLSKKRGIISEYLPWILIALAVLAIIMVGVFVFKGQGFSLIDQIKNLLRGR